jgi:hypothetical protein
MPFKIDTKGLKDYRRLMKKMPRKMVGIVGFTLNDFAFGTRDESIRYINETMTVRNQGFVRRQLWAQRAKFAAGINGMQSIAGSVRKDRFTGWREQIQGADMPRDRAITTSARGGSRARQVRRTARLMPGTKWDEPRQFQGKNARQRANEMLQELGRGRKRRPFLIYGHRTIESGLYMFGGGAKGKRKLIALQIFNRSVSVGRDPWHKKSVQRYFRARPPGRTFAKNANKAFKRMMKLR